MIQVKVDTRKKAVIVIVDDEEFILKELKILLGRTYEVHVFVNPEEAEAFVDRNEVDMVISDEMMPEMRGSVLLSKIHEKHPEVCNIVLSGQAEKDDIVRAVNEGHIFSFLYKPAERQQLMNVIEKGLENREMKMQLAEQNVQLKGYSENLEKMVEEKTAQLVKAYDRLNMLDENKMYFLVYLSQEIDSSLDRIQKLAEVLLNYFAFAGADPQLNRQKVFLRPIAEELVLELSSKTDTAGIEFDIQVAVETAVMADSEYLKKVMNTLIENAVVFSSDGGKISVTACAVNGKIQFCVSDTGRGLEPGDLLDVFKPFVIDRARRHKNGYGLNLPMAKSIIIAHEGKLWAESDGPEKGARFCFELETAV